LVWAATNRSTTEMQYAQGESSDLSARLATALAELAATKAELEEIKKSKKGSQGGFEVRGLFILGDAIRVKVGPC
jgi:hypothetical protein